MFDNKDMQTLNQYIDAEPEKRTDQEWADLLGISRSHFTMIRNRTAEPGKRLMQRIEDVTGGKVPVRVWFTTAAEAQT